MWEELGCGFSRGVVTVGCGYYGVWLLWGVVTMGVVTMGCGYYGVWLLWVVTLSLQLIKSIELLKAARAGDHKRYLPSTPYMYVPVFHLTRSLSEAMVMPPPHPFSNDLRDIKTLHRALKQDEDVTYLPHQI